MKTMGYAAGLEMIYCARILAGLLYFTFVGQTMKKEHFVPRFAGLLTAEILISAGCGIFRQQMEQNLGIGINALIILRVFWLLVMPLLIAAGLHFCFELDWGQLIHYLAMGFALKNIPFVFSDYVASTSQGENLAESVIVYALAAIPIFYVTDRTLGQRVKKGFQKQTFPLDQQCVMLFLLISISLMMQFLEFYVDADLKIYVSIIYFSVCIANLSIYNSMYRVGALAGENMQLQQMLEQSQKQYELSKESIDVINIKCHDLRKRIYTIGSLSDEEQQKIVREVGDAIDIYDAAVKTGNKALDIALMERNLVCRSKNIRMTCMADATAMSFISEGDIYALFCNLLDNAIEAADPLESEKRIINLSVQEKEGQLLIEENNFYEKELVPKEDLFATGKEDTVNHGFGLKSMRHIVNSYGGVMSVCAENGIFFFHAMIPLP